MSDGLTYSMPAMQQGLDAINQAVARLNGEHESMLSQLQPMASAWEGQGQESWAAVQQRWNGSNTDMITVLRQIGAALQHAMEIYNQNESQITAGWQ
jgi:early secretory antigenic target protein ESAT-6